MVNVTSKQTYINHMNTFKQSQARERESAKEQGFYDGRFKTKVVKDKKKELSRNWARGKGDS